MNEELLYEKALEHKDRDFLQIATAFNNTVRPNGCFNFKVRKVI